ncbi:hypothetical protein XO10_02525 [Marinitoga sp. 1135]|uniref:hypothetical protein n=1 Tax=Marinitoga TaxID=160798 RepID=UPI00031A25C1|nr:MULTISPECIES: hypothetical protein [Marinitoga]APT75441.1 hypothetical protein LN42_02835 [Marinitoga sp. 1137]NUU95168.1 hypothetical protein [Marinitoga sp. 1135]NUU97100.1 hypothetical protein [Marinitoga sp. 1138]
MNLNFLVLQFNPLNSLEENIEFIEGMVDFVYHKNPSFMFINGNAFKNGSINDDELEQISDFLSAIADYNNLTIITGQFYQKKYQLLIQKPFEELEIKKDFELKLNSGKIIAVNSNIEDNNKKLNVIINPNFEIENIDNIKAFENYVYLTQPHLGKTHIKIGDKKWVGGNLEGFISFSW